MNYTKASAAVSQGRQHMSGIAKLPLHLIEWLTAACPGRDLNNIKGLWPGHHEAKKRMDDTLLL